MNEKGAERNININIKIMGKYFSVILKLKCKEFFYSCKKAVMHYYTKPAGGDGGFRAVLK